jgi:rod shape-determining protein MreC
LNLLNEEVEIYKDSNEKFVEENEKLKIKNSQFKDQIENMKKELDNQKEKINQNKINEEELKFLRLNLIYSHKCQKTLFKQGYKVGSQKYKNCILRKGKVFND